MAPKAARALVRLADTVTLARWFSRSTDRGPAVSRKSASADSGTAASPPSESEAKTGTFLS